MAKSETKVPYFVPVSSRITQRKETFLDDIINRFPKMVQWLLTIYEKEELDFSKNSINHSRKQAKNLVYPTPSRKTKYNCKGAVEDHHSHFYDTAITESIQKWNSFRTWYEKRKKAGRETGKRFPKIDSYAPAFDSTMFTLDLDNGWITLHTGWGQDNIDIPVTVPNKKRYNNLDEEKVKSIRLKRNKNDQLVFILNQTVLENRRFSATQKTSSKSSSSCSPSPETDNPPRKPPVAVGVDLGERFLASSVTITPGNQFSEKRIQRVRFHDAPELRRTERQEVETRRKLQRKGASSKIPNRNWNFQGKKQERVREIVHEEAEWVQTLLEQGKEVHIFIGNLSTPIPRNKGSLSRRLNSFPYGELKDRLQHRLKREGAKVHLVNEYNSSRTCPECGSRNTERPTQGQFRCLNCSYQANTDYVGARNIVGRGISQLGTSKLEGAVP